MAVTGSTELNAVTDEKWDREVEEGRYQEGILMQRILNKSGLVEKSGDTVHLSYEPIYATETISNTTGAFTPQAVTPTGVDLAVDTWESCSVETVDKAQAQAFWDVHSNFPRGAGKALAQKYDDSLFALHSNFVSNIVGDPTAPTSFDDAMMLDAMLTLEDRSIPKDEMSWLLPPVAYYRGIFRKPEFRDANKTGLPRSVLTTGYVEKFLGVPAYMTTRCPTTDTNTVRKGLLLHKQAMGIAMQKKNEIGRTSTLAAKTFTYITAIRSIFGVKTFREDHGCVINIRKA